MNNAPIFIKIENYETINEILDFARQKLQQAGMLISKIDELKDEEDRIFENWKAEVMEVKTKIETISNNLPKTD